jgi:quinol-cytochrome oxidoreductase complex cytochrome b subunit
MKKFWNSALGWMVISLLCFLSAWGISRIPQNSFLESVVLGMVAIPLTAIVICCLIVTLSLWTNDG